MRRAGAIDDPGSLKPILPAANSITAQIAVRAREVVCKHERLVERKAGVTQAHEQAHPSSDYARRLRARLRQLHIHGDWVPKSSLEVQPLMPSRRLQGVRRRSSP